jgi:hypothetical protein
MTSRTVFPRNSAGRSADPRLFGGLDSRKRPSRLRRKISSGMVSSRARYCASVPCAAPSARACCVRLLGRLRSIPIAPYSFPRRCPGFTASNAQVGARLDCRSQQPACYAQNLHKDAVTGCRHLFPQGPRSRPCWATRSGHSCSAVLAGATRANGSTKSAYGLHAPRRCPPSSPVRTCGVAGRLRPRGAETKLVAGMISGRLVFCYLAGQRLRRSWPRRDLRPVMSRRSPRLRVARPHTSGT